MESQTEPGKDSSRTDNQSAKTTTEPEATQATDKIAKFKDWLKKNWKWSAVGLVTLTALSAVDNITSIATNVKNWFQSSPSANVEQNKEPEPQYLTPDNKPSPDPTVPTTGVTLIAGGGWYHSLQKSLVIVECKGRKILWLEKSDRGVFVSGEFFGPNGDVVAVLKNNQIIKNMINIFYVEQDAHSLRVWDKKNEQVVNIHFVNPTTLTFEGRLRLQDGNTFVFTHDEIISVESGGKIGGNRVKEFKSGAVFQLCGPRPE